MHSRSQVALGLALLSLGFALMFTATGCDDGCVRNSDCPTQHECTDAVCTPKNVEDAGSDASEEEDAGR